MKYKWMLLVGLISLMIIVVGCGLTPGESIAGQAVKRGVDKNQYKALQQSASEKASRQVQQVDQIPQQVPKEMPSYQERLIKPEVMTPPVQVIEKTYCLQGYVKKVKGTGMLGKDCPDQFNSYSCAEGISVPKNACPIGSNFYYTEDALYYSWFKNSPLDENGNLIKNHYFCVSDKVFKQEDLTCAKGFKLTDQWGYNDNPMDWSQNKPKYDISATDPTKAQSCIQHKATIPGETECLKKGWAFRCDVIETPTQLEYSGGELKTLFPCGTSGAKVMGGMGMGYCCGYPSQ